MGKENAEVYKIIIKTKTDFMGKFLREFLLATVNSMESYLLMKGYKSSRVEIERDKGKPNISELEATLDILEDTGRKTIKIKDVRYFLTEELYL